MKSALIIRLKRAYDSPERSDGQRILVERLWPRGVKKEALAADAWMKDVAPSTELRQWYGHQPDRWDEFRRRYRRELDAHPEAWKALLDLADQGTLTLLFSAHDTQHSGALALRDYLLEKASRQKPKRPTLRKSSVARKAATSDKPRAARKASVARKARKTTAPVARKARKTAAPRARRGTSRTVAGRARP